MVDKKIVTLGVAITTLCILTIFYTKKEKRKKRYSTVELFKNQWKYTIDDPSKFKNPLPKETILSFKSVKSNMCDVIIKTRDSENEGYTIGHVNNFTINRKNGWIVFSHLDEKNIPKDVFMIKNNNQIRLPSTEKEKHILQLQTVEKEKKD